MAAIRGRGQRSGIDNVFVNAKWMVRSRMHLAVQRRFGAFYNARHI
jgi:hypothetical protein